MVHTFLPILSLTAPHKKDVIHWAAAAAAACMHPVQVAKLCLYFVADVQAEDP